MFINNCDPVARRLIDQSSRLRWTVLASLLCLLVGCGGGESGGEAANRSTGGSGAQAGPRKATVQLNWYPEPEHGGIYQAVSDGTYQSADLSIKVLPGGRATQVGPELELGRCQFAMANADDVVLLRNQGTDVVAVMAVMQDSPRCILAREDSGVKAFSDMAGKTLQRQAGRPFLDFMRSKGLLDQVREVPYSGSVATLVSDPNIMIQAYSYSEPLLAEQQGVKVRKLMVSELGWNPYSSVLITSGNLIREDPDLVRAFVHATRTGWTNYLSDPEKGNAAILAANKHGMTSEALEFGSRELKPLAIPDGSSPDLVGDMTLERWTTLVEQMVALKLIDASNVQAEDCFSADFLK